MPPKNWRKTAPLYGCRQWWGRLFPWVKWLWRLAGLAWVIKIMLQGLTVIPEVGHFVFGFRPVIIAYLHLVMLVFVSLFMVGFFLQEKLLDDRPGLWKCGLVIFSSGVLLNEGFLLWDALPRLRVAFMHPLALLLLATACLIGLGLLCMVVSQKIIKLGNGKQNGHHAGDCQETEYFRLFGVQGIEGS